MLRLHIFLTSLLTTILAATAAHPDKLTIKVNAVEGFTGEALKNATGVMLTEKGDTVCKATKKSVYAGRGNSINQYVTLSFDIPRTPGEYIMEASADGYTTLYRQVKVEQVGPRETERSLPDLVFYKAPKQLGEVTVTASKVKFYMNNDTLIYNADAFQLPEGSMLDALIKQLPGVEIRDGGEIYVNGKYVESLLLNGRDFFNGNKELMLNNLAYYTVKNISVYDKMSEKSKLAGRDLGDSQYVMDVKLKRDYMSGFIGNIEGGAGTASRYLGRLFSMWYTSRSRLALIANVNNLNDSRQPGQNDQYTATNAPGDFSTRMAGLSYNVNSVNPDNDWEFSGSTTVSHIRSNTQAIINKTNYLTGGNTYENRFNNALSHNLTVSSDNTLHLRPKDKYIGISQTFSYRNNDQTARALSGAFNSQITDLTQEVLETIYSGEATSFSDITLNSALTQALLSGHTLSAGGGVNFETKVPSTPDLFSSSFNIDYTRSNYYGFDLYDINYNRDNAHSTSYSYTRNHPDHDLNFNGGLSYTYVPSDELSMLLSGYYFHSSSTKDSYFYRLDRLSDAGIFGNLPADYQSALDNGQSHISTMRTHDAYVQLNLNYKKKFASGGMLTLSIKPIGEYLWRSLDYRQTANDQYVKDNSFKLWFYNTYISYKHGNNTFQLKYDRNVNMLPLDRLVTITDTRDPLNIYIGAKKLKNSAQNDFTLSWQYNVFNRHPWSNYISLAGSITQDALVSAYSFNSLTGVRTYMMQNVSGNWFARIHDNFYKAFGPIDQFNITATSRITYGNNADLTAIDSDHFTKNIIKNLELSEDMRLNWRIGKQTIGLRARVEWRDTRGDRRDFINFSATTAQYGLNGTFALPYNLGIATDLNLYTRRGYDYSELNTTDVVWNARLTYTPKGGRWTFMLDGFDLLHQLSNVTYNVNAQGRTETWTNSLPRYGLLHIQYRFNKQPHKK
ncbi:MAG: hypothetical protein NC043_08960 [Muribaculaceae bacterium]|nr:hypothetical protein [Muribaculaceae bacterium]